MLSATIGATASVLPAGAAPKPETQEQNFNSTSAAEKEAPIVKDASVPAVPATNGAPLSVDAVTALQQVQAEEATAEQRVAGAATAAVDNEEQANLLVAQSEDTDGVAAATVQVEELEQEATASRDEASEEISVGEETDTAGRSVRNPLDLQI
ncbi:hypothetical protein A9Q83_03620 [Alphaproteobacteria bacterium 46_93_T64]|nr:hypothetical protein A9Q83_03620 [Alphaproteobacteria bacterium 46_93_T64]